MIVYMLLSVVSVIRCCDICFFVCSFVLSWIIIDGDVVIVIVDSISVIMFDMLSVSIMNSMSMKVSVVFVRFDVMSYGLCWI